MPETTKLKDESKQGDVENTELEQDLNDIRNKQKKQSILSKLHEYIRRAFSRDKDSKVGKERFIDNSARAEAISNFTDESGRVRGSIEEHRAEEQRIIDERERSGHVDVSGEETQRKSELRKRAIAELEQEHIYVRGGPEEIQRRMAEIEARDMANKKNSDISEKV